MIQEEKRAKTKDECLEIVKEFLGRAAVEISIKQFHDGTYRIVGYGYNR